jgi:hypothetical protein
MNLPGWAELFQDETRWECSALDVNDIKTMIYILRGAFEDTVRLVVG